MCGVGMGLKQIIRDDPKSCLMFADSRVFWNLLV